MIREAEMRSEEDKKIKDMIEARNMLEKFAYSIRDEIIDDESLKERMIESDKKIILEGVDEILDFLEREMHPTVEKCDEMYDKLDKIVHPIFRRYGVIHHTKEEFKSQQKQNEEVNAWKCRSSAGRI